MRKHRKRLSMDIPTELHDLIKELARERGITITRWVMRACYIKASQEQRDKEN